MTFSRALKAELICLPALLAVACGEASTNDEPAPDAPTYYQDAKAIIDAKCANCHRPDDIGPFSLTTYEEVKAFAGPVRAAIASGTMPPWQPSDECNSFAGNIDLTLAEKDMLLAWLGADLPAGDPSRAPTNTPDPTDTFATDISLQLPEPYTPTREPDDYRCQLIPWPSTETRFVTGVRVKPDKRAIVHHVILFLAGPDQVAQYQAFDDAEEGPGYTCYGGPRAGDGGGLLGNVSTAEILAALNKLGISPGDLQSGNISQEQLVALMDELGIEAGGGFRSIGSWVPGVPNAPLPAGTGIRVEPGSMIVAQFHYNTQSAAPVADQSSVEIATSSTVAKEATILPIVDLGWISNGRVGGDAMSIPQGMNHVEHATSLAFDSMFFNQARQTLGLAADAPLIAYSANHHMHELGTSQRSEIRHQDGSKTCLLDIPDWDFNWQGSYTFEAPVELRSGDEIWMGCAWDNSPANQPIIDGQARASVDVSWGEGTSDEMCLGALYVTGL